MAFVASSQSKRRQETSIYVPLDEDETCEAGVPYLSTDGCNTCMCPESGSKSGPKPCTKMMCINMESADLID